MDEAAQDRRGESSWKRGLNVGELSFTSFEVFGLHFLRRDEPLEAFTDQFPESPCLLAGWFIPLDSALWPAVEALQRCLRPVDWLRPYPAHLQHLWLGSLGWAMSWPTEATEEWVERGREALRNWGAFTVDFPRLNCFHNAVVSTRRTAMKDTWPSWPIASCPTRT